MSKLKTPREKKLASLALDTRNVYRENDKSSRKAIPLRKKLSHQAVRRASSEALLTVENMDTCDQEAIERAEANLLSAELGADRKRFRKRPDESLGAILQTKADGDWTRLSRKRK